MGDSIEWRRHRGVSQHPPTMDHSTFQFTTIPTAEEHLNRHESYMVFVGVCLNAIGSFLAAGAFIVQKFTHNDEADVVMCCRWRWWVGFFMLLSAGILEGFSLAWAPLSIVAPLSGLTVLLNTVFAVVFLGEKFRWYEAVIVILLAAGIGLTTGFGPHTTTAKRTDAAYFEHLMSTKTMPYYYLAVVGALVVFFCLIVGYERCHS